MLGLATLLGSSTISMITRLLSSHGRNSWEPSPRIWVLNPRLITTTLVRSRTISCSSRLFFTWNTSHSHTPVDPEDNHLFNVQHIIADLERLDEARISALGIIIRNPIGPQCQQCPKLKLLKIICYQEYPRELTPVTFKISNDCRRYNGVQVLVHRLNCSPSGCHRRDIAVQSMSLAGGDPLLFRHPDVHNRLASFKL